MFQYRLLLIFLLLSCFSLATYLQPRQAAREAARGQSETALALLLGDGRRMFANTFYAKADAYFHRGNYPSIFDTTARHEEDHMSAEAGHKESHELAEDEADVPVPASDWVAQFNRRLSPALHEHLQGSEEREMLPWLRMSVELDPHQVDVYMVTAYWLGRRLGRVDEAERFLCEGLRANPNHPQLLNELGRLYFDQRKDFLRARNVWLAALRHWHRIEAPKEKPNYLVLEAIFSGLAEVDFQQGRYQEAIEYLEQLKQVSPQPAEVARRIEEFRAKLPRN